jgi:23S rRNA pseudouridine2604 synthase
MTQPPAFKRAPRPEGKGETAEPSGTSRLNKRMAELRMSTKRPSNNKTDK